MARPDHLAVLDSGDLYDTRGVGWASSPPLRRGYERTARRIRTVAQFKATLRAGPYAWPGGYPLLLAWDDGGVLCFDCGRSRFCGVVNDIRNGGTLLCDVFYEGAPERCDYCDREIESAYGDPENDD